MKKEKMVPIVWCGPPALQRKVRAAALLEGVSVSAFTRAAVRRACQERIAAEASEFPREIQAEG